MSFERWLGLNHRLCELLGTPLSRGHRAQCMQLGTGRRNSRWWSAGGAKPRPCPIVDNLVAGGGPLSQAASWGLS